MAKPTVEDLIDRVAELRSEIADAEKGQTANEERICKPVADKLAASREQHKRRLDILTKELKTTEDRAKKSVLALGETVKTDLLEFRYNAGRTTWDNAMLEGYALAHPEIVKARSVGGPFVTICVVKKES